MSKIALCTSISMSGACAGGSNHVTPLLHVTVMRVQPARYFDNVWTTCSTAGPSWPFSTEHHGQSKLMNIKCTIILLFLCDVQRCFLWLGERDRKYIWEGGLLFWKKFCDWCSPSNFPNVKWNNLTWYRGCFWCLEKERSCIRVN